MSCTGYRMHYFKPLSLPVGTHLHMTGHACMGPPFTSESIGRGSYNFLRALFTRDVDIDLHLIKITFSIKQVNRLMCEVD